MVDATYLYQMGLMQQGQTVWQGASSGNAYDAYIVANYGAALAEQGAYTTSGLWAFGYLGSTGTAATSTQSPVVAIAPAPTSPPPPPHLQFTASPIGTSIFLMLANCRLPGQIIWADGIDASNTVLDTSYLTFAACYGEPIDSTESITLTALYANGTKFWSSSTGALNPGNISNDDFLALQSTISSMKIYYGTESQAPDPTMEAALGIGLVPAFRGLRYIVFQDFPLSVANNSVPNITAEWSASSPTVANAMDKLITHVHTRSDTRRACSPSINLGGADPGCSGVTITTQDTLLSHLQTHKLIFGYQIQEGNPVKIVRRAVDGGLVVDKSVNEADLVAQKGTAAINLQRVNPTRLPFGIDLQYMDSGYSFDNKLAQARHNASRVSNTITSCYSNYSFTANTARSLSYDILYKLRSEALTGTIELDDMSVEVSDIIDVTTNEGDVHTVLVQQQTNTKSRSNQLSVLGLLSSQGADITGDGGDWFASTGKKPWPEFLFNGLSFDVDSSVNRIWAKGEEDGVHITFGWNYLTSPLRFLSLSKWKDWNDGSFTQVGDFGEEFNNDLGSYFSGSFGIFHDDHYFYFMADSICMVARIPKDSSNVADFEILKVPQGCTVDGTGGGSGGNDNIDGNLCGVFAQIHNGKLYRAWNGKWNGVGDFSGNEKRLLIEIDLALWSPSAVNTYDYQAFGVGATQYAQGMGITDDGVVVIATVDSGTNNNGIIYYANVSNLNSWGAHTSTIRFDQWSCTSKGHFAYFAEGQGTAAARKSKLSIVDTTSGGFSETVVDLHTADTNFEAHTRYYNVNNLWCSDTHLFVVGNQSYNMNGLGLGTEHRYLARFTLGSSPTADGGRFLGEIWYNELDHVMIGGKYDNGRCYIGLESFGAGTAFLYIDEDLDPTSVGIWAPRPGDAIPPSNNAFADRKLLEVDKTLTGDMTFCNTETSEPHPDYLDQLISPQWAENYQNIFYNNGHSLWYSFTAPETTNYTLTGALKIGAGNYPGLQVYTGSSIGSLTPVAGTSQYSFFDTSHDLTAGQVHFFGTAGTEYIISVTLFQGTDVFGGALLNTYLNGSPYQLGTFTLSIAGDPATGASANLTGIAATGSAGTVSIADPFFSSVGLLMGFEGANLATGAPGMNDESTASNKGTASGGSSSSNISTTQFKFGASSAHFQGNNLTFADNADWHLGSGNFTVEAFIRTTTSGVTQCLVSHFGTNAPNLGWTIYINTSNHLAWNVSTTGSDNLNDITGSTTLSQNTWYHVCIDYDGSKYRLYVDGVMVGSSTTSRTIFAPSVALGLGANSTNTGNRFSGYMDEVRITKGVARYANDSGFTAPTLAFPRG